MSVTVSTKVSANGGSMWCWCYLVLPHGCCEDRCNGAIYSGGDDAYKRRYLGRTQHVAQYTDTSLCFVLDMVGLSALAPNTDASVVEFVYPYGKRYMRVNDFYVVKLSDQGIQRSFHHHRPPGIPVYPSHSYGVLCTITSNLLSPWHIMYVYARTYIILLRACCTFSSCGSLFIFVSSGAC